MTDRFIELFGKNLLGIRKLLRLPPSSQKLPVVGSDNSGSLTIPSGRELFVLAVPVELRDLLYAQLFELQDRERHAQVDRKRVRFAEWEFDLLDHCLVTPKGNVARLPGLEYALLKTFINIASSFLLSKCRGRLTNVFSSAYSIPGSLATLPFGVTRQCSSKSNSHSPKRTRFRSTCAYLSLSCNSKSCA